MVSERSRLGDWEGDLVVGPMSRSAVATLVDRRSGFLRLVHLPQGHRSEQLLSALTSTLQPMPRELLRTLTWDQGSEMASQVRVALLFAEGVFFANPGSPWSAAQTNTPTDSFASTCPEAPASAVHRLRPSAH